MIYNITHKTTYTYQSLVGFARCVLRLTPRSSAWQTVLEHEVTVTPRPMSTTRRIGPFEEPISTVIVDQPHRALVIEARSRVDVHAKEVDLNAPSPSWEAIRDMALQSTDLSVQGPASYLYPTGLAPLAVDITDYVRESFTPGRPVLQAGAELMTRIQADFLYDPEATSVFTPSPEAFAAKGGVCQDFAHIMISGLRGLGLPAAYVSGYLRTLPPPGQPRLEGADATHAWVCLWCGPERGWIGFDPTNAVFAVNDHIVLAFGRDYSDVAPIDGVLLAPGAQKLKVAVDVSPLETADRLL